MTTAVSTAEIWAKVAAEQTVALEAAKKALVQATANAAAAARNFNTSQQALANAYATGASAAQIAALNANTIALSNQQIVANSQVNNAAQTVQATQTSLTEANQKVAANLKAEQTSIDQPAGPVTSVPAANTENTPLPAVENPSPAQVTTNLAQNAATNEAIQDKKPPESNLAQNAATTNEAAQDKKVVSGDPPIDRRMADADYINNLIPTTGERGAQGLTLAKLDAQSQATTQDVVNFQAKADWRVRLSLSPGAQQAQYLYYAQDPGILAPLLATDGVIFPYTPSISVSYNANYEPTELTHSNYKFFTYRNSNVDSITLGCDFTAQDTFEANYLLAVIHFFRTATKMFYGQDQNPKNGTPPPLCYLSGLGAFQFDAHPLAITGFNYSLPTDVDYIRAGNNPSPAGVNRENSPSQPKATTGFSVAGAIRMLGSFINPGAIQSAPQFRTPSSYTATREPTYVPTKITLSITAVPIVTRNDISNKFSLKQYATGSLLRGTKRAGGGMW